MQSPAGIRKHAQTIKFLTPGVFVRLESLLPRPEVLSFGFYFVMIVWDVCH